MRDIALKQLTLKKLDVLPTINVVKGSNTQYWEIEAKKPMAHQNLENWFSKKEKSFIFIKLITQINECQS